MRLSKIYRITSPCNWIHRLVHTARPHLVIASQLGQKQRTTQWLERLERQLVPQDGLDGSCTNTGVLQSLFKIRVAELQSSTRDVLDACIMYSIENSCSCHGETVRRWARRFAVNSMSMIKRPVCMCCATAVTAMEQHMCLCHVAAAPSHSQAGRRRPALLCPLVRWGR